MEEWPESRPVGTGNGDPSGVVRVSNLGTQVLIVSSLCFWNKGDGQDQLRRTTKFPIPQTNTIVNHNIEKTLYSGSVEE